MVKSSSRRPAAQPFGHEQDAQRRRPCRCALRSSSCGPSLLSLRGADGRIEGDQRGFRRRAVTEGSWSAGARVLAPVLRDMPRRRAACAPDDDVLLVSELSFRLPSRQENDRARSGTRGSPTVLRPTSAMACQTVRSLAGPLIRALPRTVHVPRADLRFLVAAHVRAMLVSKPCGCFARGSCT